MQLRESPHERLILVQQAQHLHEVHTYRKKLRTPDCYIHENELGPLHEEEEQGGGCSCSAMLLFTVLFVRVNSSEG